MVNSKVTLFAVAMAALAVAHANPIGGYGGAESYASISTGQVSSPVLSYAAPVQTVQAYAPAVASYSKVLEPEIIAYPQYGFKYGVEDPKTGDVKDQAEERDGDLVKGEYSLLQPDGRKRVVNYICDKKNGCNTVVSYLGKAVHPEVVKLVQVQAPVKLVQVQAPVKLASYGGSYGSSSEY